MTGGSSPATRRHKRKVRSFLVGADPDEMGHTTCQGVFIDRAGDLTHGKPSVESEVVIAGSSTL